MDRWTLEDDTSAKAGFCRILLDGKDVGIDVFPFRKGANPYAIKETAGAVVAVLNAANYWRFGGDGLGPEKLEDAVDALKTLHES